MTGTFFLFYFITVDIEAGLCDRYTLFKIICITLTAHKAFLVPVKLHILQKTRTHFTLLGSDYPNRSLTPDLHINTRFLEHS